MEEDAGVLIVYTLRRIRPAVCDFRWTAAKHALCCATAAVILAGVAGCGPPPPVPRYAALPVLPAALSAQRNRVETPPLTEFSSFKPRKAEVEYVRVSAPEIALTFDAGASAAGVAPILQALSQRQARATFFLTGKFCRQFPQQARSIADAGMELGNHSDTHPYFTHLSDNDIRNELKKAEAAIRHTCGRGAKPLFRYPYGDSNDRTRAVVAGAGYQAIGWSLDSLDSVGKPKPAGFVADRIEKKAKSGYIVLMHVSFPDTAAALPHILDELDRRGIRVVPVSQLIRSRREGPGVTIARLSGRRKGSTVR